MAHNTYGQCNDLASTPGHSQLHNAARATSSGLGTRLVMAIKLVCPVQLSLTFVLLTNVDQFFVFFFLPLASVDACVENVHPPLSTLGRSSTRHRTRHQRPLRSVDLYSLLQQLNTQEDERIASNQMCVSVCV